MKVIVIIPAAGLGTRMSSAGGAKRSKPSATKQFAELAGVPVLVRTLQNFVSSSEISEIHVALRASELASFRDRLQGDFPQILGKKPVLVEGGEHRQESVGNALAQISAAPDDLVLVHDAVRPFITHEIIHDVIKAAQQYGAAIVGIPAMDTVKQVDRTAEGAVIKATIPRQQIVLAQTPQGFRRLVLERAHQSATSGNSLDDASLVEALGLTVRTVPGDPAALKITTRADLLTVAALVGERVG